jgi:hypothetical protein
MVAPDGEIPNSVLSKIIKEWQLVHKGFILTGPTFRSWNRQKKEQAGVDEEQLKKSKAYKERLKRLLEQKEQEKKEEEERAKAAEAEKQRLLEEEELLKAQAQEIQKQRRPSIKVSSNLTQILAPLEQKYPRIIEQALAYSWFPRNEVSENIFFGLKKIFIIMRAVDFS